MELVKPVGRAAASHKYDVLSALMAFGLSLDKTRQRQVLRLLSLITTRYNWQRDELSMGQDAIATLWCVDTRTVKREMSKLQSMGWLVLKRRGARGRVSVYGLDLTQIMRDTRPAWENIGPDFVDRMAPDRPPQPPSNIVPLHTGPKPVSDGSTWSAAKEILFGEDAPRYQAWFQTLAEIETREGWLHLAAPTTFHATYVETHFMGVMIKAVRRIDPSIAGLRVLG